MQTTEKTDNGVKSLVDYIVLQTFKPRSELLVCVLGNINGRKLLLVHKFLERVVPCFLKHHLVRKRVLYQLVNFGLKFQQFFGEQVWIFYIFFIHDDFLTAHVDVRIHLVDNESECVLVSAEHLKEKLQFLEILLLEHVDTPSVLAGYRLGHFGNQFLLDDFQHLLFGLRLQPIIRIRLLVDQRVPYPPQVFRAIALRVPKLRACLEIFLSHNKKFILEMVVIYVQGTITLPDKESILCTNRLRLDETHVNKNLYALHDDLSIDGTTAALSLDLVENCLSDPFFSVIKNRFLEHGLTLLADELKLVVLQVIPIQVLKTSIHHLRVNNVALPSLDQIV